MKIIRRRDGVSGWAVQMVIPFTFNGELWPQGSYIAECGGVRWAWLKVAFHATYMRPL